MPWQKSGSARALGLLVTLACCVSLGLHASVAPGAQPAAPAGEPAALSREEIAAFLTSAKVIGAKGLSKGVTRPVRLTLTDGRITHDAVFQAVDESRAIERFQGGRVEMDFRDSWHYNVAAYRLADRLGLGDMVPVTVERIYRQARGSLAWWVDWKWDEQMRSKANLQPPDVLGWSKQQSLMRVFSELVYDTDRNQTNLLITEDWKLWMVDFSRAFRKLRFLRRPELVQRCSRDLLARLRTLTVEDVLTATGDHLSQAEAEAIIDRRDKIVERLDTLARERGEALVYF